MKTRSIANILRFLTPQQMAEEIVRLDAALAEARRVTVAWGSPEPRPPCAVCGTPAEKHGSYPTCASHPYTSGVVEVRRTEYTPGGLPMTVVETKPARGVKGLGNAQR